MNKIIRRSYRFCTYTKRDIKPDNVLFHNTINKNREKLLIKEIEVCDEYISEDEEKSILDEILPYMKRLRYEYDHWDNAIHGFKETERLNWNERNALILDRVRKYAFKDVAHLPHVHILDLAEDGYIKPHVDSVRFCGEVIAGLSLLSDSIMRFVKNDEKFDVLLKRRSLYIMRGEVRNDFTHEILANDVSYFNGTKIDKKRRISIICRSEPNSSES